MTDELNGLLRQAVDRATGLGASGADAVAVDVLEGSVRVRLGEVEEIQRARERKLGLRVLFGGRQAITSTSDLRPETVERLVEDTCAMARLTAEDPMAGLPDPKVVPAHHEQIPGLHDPAADDFDLRAGADWAREAEAAAMADDRITNSEGGSFSFASAVRAYESSVGASGRFRTSSFAGWVVPVATQDGAMERDYHYSARHHVADLASASEIGRIAAERALRRLGARRVKTAKVPVVFDDRTASALLGHIASALGGYSLYRGASVLAGKLGQVIAAPGITIIDDATLPGGPASRPYDGEGLASRRNAVISEGVLQSYLLDTYSARKLDLASTANARRSVGDSPTAGPTNLHLLAGDTAPEDLLTGIKSGFYVTELIGFGVNITTGDYSQGAAGLWIEDGKLSYAVTELTIAGNLLDMLQSIEAVGSDLDVHRSVSAPSLRIREMTVAGE